MTGRPHRPTCRRTHRLRLYRDLLQSDEAPQLAPLPFTCGLRKQTLKPNPSQGGTEYRSANETTTNGGALTTNLGKATAGIVRMDPGKVYQLVVGGQNLQNAEVNIMLFRSGLVDGNNTLDLASSDGITETDAYLESHSGTYWLRTDTTVYARLVLLC